MPFQTTALTHVSVVMGGEHNIGEAIDNILANPGVKFIGLHTTGVGETSGVDLGRVVAAYRKRRPTTPVVWVDTPDYEGSLQTGYAKAVDAILDTLVEEPVEPLPRRVALLAGPYLTPGEIETMKEWFEPFGLDPIFVPDVGSALNGFVTDDDFIPHAIGGAALADIARLSDVATVVSVGRSLGPVAEKFGKRWDIPVARFDHLTTMEEIDRFFLLLSRLSGRPVPARIARARRHLQDAILDTHFFYAGVRVGLAGDPDFLIRWRAPLEAIGVGVAAVSPLRHDGAVVGDLTDLRRMVDDEKIDLLVGNSHVAELADDVGLAVVRAGLPVYDRIGEPQSVRIGYQGVAALYREGANALMERRHALTPYTSHLQESLR
jgi:nitrogenase molybdenum-iron protein NifN